MICGLLILLFTYASMTKLLDFKSFYGQMNAQPMPNWMTPYLVWIVPGVELLIVGALIVERTRKIGLWAALFIMSIFTVYVALAVFKVFERVPCSCGGVLKGLGWTQHLYFNIFFTALAAWGIYLIKKPKKTNDITQPVFT